jgi:hypothetical protein
MPDSTAVLLVRLVQVDPFVRQSSPRIALERTNQSTDLLGCAERVRVGHEHEAERLWGLREGLPFVPSIEQVPVARCCIRIPGSATRGARGKGHGRMGRRSTKTSSRPRASNACRECGVTLTNPDRQYCRDCLPKFKDRRTDNLVRAARRVLEEMRTSPDDPARSAEAIAKRVAAHSKRRTAALAWAAANPGPHDATVFRQEIAPKLSGVTLPANMRATGLSSAYCWRIRRGERVPHPMYWQALRELGRPR